MNDEQRKYQEWLKARTPVTMLPLPDRPVKVNITITPDGSLTTLRYEAKKGRL